MITGKRNSEFIGKASGDRVVFDIENMFDPKVNRERTSMLLHKATDPARPVSSGCIVIVQEEYDAFREHMLEVLKEYGKLAVAVTPVREGKTNAAFAVKKAEDTHSPRQAAVPAKPFGRG